MDYLVKLQKQLEQAVATRNIVRAREIQERIETEERRRSKGYGTPEEPRVD